MASRYRCEAPADVLNIRAAALVHQPLLPGNIVLERLNYSLTPLVSKGAPKSVGQRIALTAHSLSSLPE
jgi:hypothetical protein